MIMCKSKKPFFWVLVTGLLAVAGYVLWQRSQPVEDPWAEEYWEDAELVADTTEEA